MLFFFFCKFVLYMFTLTILLIYHSLTPRTRQIKKINKYKLIKNLSNGIILINWTSSSKVNRTSWYIHKNISKELQLPLMQGLFKLSLQSSHDPSIWLHVLLQLWGHCEEQFFPWVPTSQALINKHIQFIKH